jgi:hypothetical protein
MSKKIRQIWQRERPTRPDWVPRIGETVLVQKGSLIYSTHPSWGIGEAKKAGRTYPIKVKKAYTRPVRTSYSDPEGHNGYKDEWTVEWPGTGGYWKWCALRDVEPVPTELEMLAAVPLT